MAAVADRPGTLGVPPVARRNVGAWLVSMAFSLGADEMFFLALTWAAIQVGSPAQVGLVVAAGALPRVVLLLVGGALADRGRARRVAAVSGTARAVALLVAAAVVGFGSLPLWQLLVVAVVVGGLDGFFAPAVQALPPQLAPDHTMGRVAALRVVTQWLVLPGVGPLTGVLIAWSGIGAAFWVAGGLFLLSTAVLALLVLDAPGTAAAAADQTDGAEAAGAAEAAPSEEAGGRRTGLLREVADGLAWVRRDPVLPWLLVLVTGLNLGFNGPINAGLPLLSAEQGWGAAGAGFLVGGLGVGAALSGITVFFVGWVPRAGLVVLAVIALEGVALAALAVVGSLALALVAVALVGVASGMAGSVVHALLLTTTPAAQLGRVMAILGLTIEATFPVSNVVFGALAEAGGLGPAFVAGGVVMVVSVLVTATRPSVRSIALVRQPRRTKVAAV